MSLKTFVGSLAAGAKSLGAVLAVTGMTIGLSVISQPAQADAGFQRWVAEFRAVAQQNGISNATFDRAFQGVTAPDPDVLRLASNQPEFNAPVWQYFDNQINDQSIAVGRQMASRHSRLLDQIEQRFGVDRHIVLAIWSIESRYGEALNNPSIVRNIVR
jgi:membrane-bound lytic murein transglycosylase B